jgi:hypothetical protein
MINIKKELVKIVLGLTYIIGFYNTIRYFNLNIFWIYVISLTTSTIMMLYSRTFKLKKWFITAISIATLFSLLRLMSFYISGVASFIIGVVAISTIILIAKRKKFTEAKHHIETMIWGKPLKEYISIGEKPPKVEIKR